ncbi:MAG: response regulator [Anaerolineae bacterium]|nr:response regulator [Anaerolineae bacterium]
MKTILVIEDENDIRENIIEALELEDFEVFGAPNGKVGVQLARQHDPDLVLCDIMMPIMDGYQVLVALREHPLTSLTPVIFLTARTDRGAMRYGMELGADDYIPKPFQAEELIRAIHTRLKRQEDLKREYERKLADLRGSIIYTMPHELRTPLSSILGYSELLLMDPEVSTATLVDMAESIFRAGTRLHHTIENYLVYAQTEILFTDRERRALLQAMRLAQPRALIEFSARAVAESAHRTTDLTLAVTDVPALRIIEENLKKIVEELVDNACKFSEPATPIQVASVVEDGTYRLVISDRGRGMTPEQIDAVGAYMQFERKLYEQQGSGLGLTLALRLAELHGGTLVVESEPQAGTTVQVTLPLA